MDRPLPPIVGYSFVRCYALFFRNPRRLAGPGSSVGPSLVVVLLCLDLFGPILTPISWVRQIRTQCVDVSLSNTGLILLTVSLLGKQHCLGSRVLNEVSLSALFKRKTSSSSTPHTNIRKFKSQRRLATPSSPTLDPAVIANDPQAIFLIETKLHESRLSDRPLCTLSVTPLDCRGFSWRIGSILTIHLGPILAIILSLTHRYGRECCYPLALYWFLWQPVTGNRDQSWSLLRHLSCMNTLPWLCAGVGRIGHTFENVWTGQWVLSPDKPPQMLLFPIFLHWCLIIVLFCQSVLVGITPCITTSQNTTLTMPFTSNEVKIAVFQLPPLKAPGPNGFHASFYRTFSDTVGDDLTHFCLGVLNGHADVSFVNEATIVLIPKSVFIPERLIIDTSLLAAETLHTYWTHRSGRQGLFALKLDMSKTYDRVGWCFLEQVLLRFGFHTQWVSLLMSYVQSVRYRVRVNGKLSEFDSMWSFFSSPFVPDDCLVFGRANHADVAKLRSIVRRFEECSDRLISWGKAEHYIPIAEGIDVVPHKSVNGPQLVEGRKTNSYQSCTAVPSNLPDEPLQTANPALSVIKAKYYPVGGFFTSELGAQPSYAWRSIWSVKGILAEGLRAQLGDGTTIPIFTLHWVPHCSPTDLLQSCVNTGHLACVSDLIDQNLVRSTYNYLLQLDHHRASTATQDRSFYKLLWAQPLLEKDPNYLRCGQAQESILHAFIACNHLQSTWELQEWIFHAFFLLLWSIWVALNRHLHQGSVVSDVETMVNFDGSFNREIGRGGVGCVIRNFDGKFLAACSRSIIYAMDAFHVESLGCLEGMHLAISLGHLRVVVKGNSRSVISGASTSSNNDSYGVLFWIAFELFPSIWMFAASNMLAVPATPLPMHLRVKVSPLALL
ncbi:hypothetical protein F3Y22_tig00110722pilonHSYRG00005 [Hibiscus syriacus]|uniref:RNase H type-1 domain-containing protein n=1 Tax=Hibiscus syriacus TaxID=106335 RepID=A0A6A2ZT87_HIBSY|nr:hypothetical protein F3Y22_tig00110722pilonHSYRG00005 [Hibiscus syriacus]